MDQGQLLRLMLNFPRGRGRGYKKQHINTTHLGDKIRDEMMQEITIRRGPGTVTQVDAELPQGHHISSSIHPGYQVTQEVLCR